MDDDTNHRLEDEAVLEYLRKQQTIALASKPRYPAEAFTHVSEGLTRVIDACAELRQVPEYRKLQPEHWHIVRMISEGLMAAIQRGDADAIDALRTPVLAWHKKWGSAPFAGAALRVQGKAQDFARVLERAKTIGIGPSILELDGKTSTPEPPPSRWQAALYLATALTFLNQELQDPAFAELPPEDQRANAVYARMPSGGHGSQTDRTGAFRNDLFAEDGEKTVIAAFKAFGMDAGRADQLFKANLQRRNRNLEKSRRKQRR